MEMYIPDLSKVPRNPFAFKTDPKEAQEALRSRLTLVARFFADEVGALGEVETAWWNYQQANGADAIIRVASAVFHVLGVREQLRVITDCDAHHDTGWFGSLLVLLHIGLIELIEGITHVNFAAWALTRTEGSDPVSPASTKPKDVRRYLTTLKGDYEKLYGTARRLARALQEGLSDHEKARLFLAYKFSAPYRLGESPDPWDLKHLHCSRRRANWDRSASEGTGSIRYPWPELCGPRCPRPEREEIRALMPMLAKKYLYAMRNQLVHAASAVMIAATDNKHRPVQFGKTLSDAFFADDKHLISYEVSLSVSEVTGILRRCAWSRLRASHL